MGRALDDTYGSCEMAQRKGFDEVIGELEAGPLECDICGGEAKPDPVTGGYLSASHPGWYLEILCSQACAAESVRRAQERVNQRYSTKAPQL